MLFSLYRSIPRDYGMDVLMSEVDVHTLGYIQEHPGILAKQIAEMTYRSKGRFPSPSPNWKNRDFWSSVSTRKRNLSAICT